MSLLFIPLGLIIFLVFAYRVWKSPRVSKFFEDLKSSPTPDSADALVQEREQLKVKEVKLKESIVEKRKNLLADADKLSEK